MKEGLERLRKRKEKRRTINKCISLKPRKWFREMKAGRNTKLNDVNHAKKLFGLMCVFVMVCAITHTHIYKYMFICLYVLYVLVNVCAF